jgi:hypothetical protein
MVRVRLFWRGDFAPISGLRSPREPHRVSGFRSAFDCGAAARSSTDRLAELSRAGDYEPVTATISQPIAACHPDVGAGPVVISTCW